MISKCYLNFYFVAFILNILAALDKPTAGEVHLNGKNLVSLKEKEISAFRREHLGFVFQDFNLVVYIFLRLLTSKIAISMLLYDDFKM